MIKPPSFTPDFLADAPLTPEQRQAWDKARAELNAMRGQVRELEKRLQELEHIASDDAAMILTRPEFNREVARMLAFDERYGGVSSVLYFDIENLGSITERFGKAVANAAVRELSDALVTQVRNSDIVGRLAGDEFGVLLIRCPNPEAWKKGKDLANSIMSRLAEVQGCAIEPQISYGAYTFGEDKDVAVGIKEASSLMTKITIKP